MWFALSIAPAKAETIRIVGFGDSLMAGFELPPEDAFPAKLQLALTQLGHDVKIDNAGVSGDTASAGLARLDWAVPDGTQGVILELGANDALRGIDPSVTEKALDEILTKLGQRDIQVLLAGMRAPPNMGADYTKAFDGIFPRLAQKHDVVFYPFFLDGVAADPSLNLADGIHPNAQGVDEIVERILPSVETLITRIEGGKS